MYFDDAHTSSFGWMTAVMLMWAAPLSALGPSPPLVDPA